MNKKHFIIVSVLLFILFIISGNVFATNNVKNAVNGATDTFIDGVSELGSDVRNGIGNAENGIEDALRMNSTDDNNAGNANDGNNAETTDANVLANDTVTDYTATRTTADVATATGTDNTNTLWIWLIVAIAAIVIIGLVWYYGTQNTTHRS